MPWDEDATSSYPYAWAACKGALAEKGALARERAGGGEGACSEKKKAVYPEL